ncbi:MAG: ABC transporter permease [Thermomicrobiales bacterium]|nr:ABC transporter permease [Thermomicrobiales bacterium]MCO5223366.1 ABC transporter permease [Thermomicrobiales bacterium]
MTALLIRRLLMVIPTLFFVSLISFAIIRAAPGDPVRMYTSSGMSKADAEDVERIRENLGLNDPLPVQYVRWLEQAVQGNLGYSIVSHRPVTELIAEKLPASLSLMGISLVLSMTLGILIGSIAAVKRYSLFDYATTIFAFLGSSLPSFWLSMILIWFFAVRLGWLPTGQMHSFRPSGPVWLDTAKHFVLPVIVTSYVGLIVWVRYQRSSMIEALNQDYVRTARAKGLNSKAVLYRHAWRNSLVPIVTLFGFSIANLVAGSYVIEYVFSWPGMANFGFDAILKRDYPVIMGVTLVSSIFIITGNLIADICYMFINPQIRNSR